MQANLFTDKYTKVVKFRLRKLAEIAAISKLCGLEELYRHVKSTYDSMADEYNSVVETTIKDSRGQSWDNLSSTTTYVQMIGPMQEDSDYRLAYNHFSHTGNKSELILALEYKLNEMKQGFDDLNTSDEIRCHQNFV